jgi:surfactin synthase thioesterase subunit
VPPGYLDPTRPLSKMTDAQRLEWCRALGTFPAGDKDSDALFGVFADVIGADCEVFESATGVPLDHHAPLLILLGDSDPACPVHHVARWADTHPQAVIRTLPGGHMLPQHSARSVAAEVAGFLRNGRNGAEPARRATRGGLTEMTEDDESRTKPNVRFDLKRDMRSP